MLSADLAMAIDPMLWVQRNFGLELDPWQGEVLRSRAGRVLMNCARQTGKSTVTALLALHTALYRPGALVLLLSPSLRQSSELFRLVAGFYHQLGDSLPPDAESALRMELPNRSRVVSLPGKERTVRGFAGVDLLVIDEAARVDDELYYAVRPMLAVSRGRMVVLSTPFGKRGWFHHEWSEGQGWERVKVTAAMCPRISAEFLEQERAAVGDWWYAQEYECEFVDTAGQVFSYDLVMAAISNEVEPLFGGGHA